MDNCLAADMLDRAEHRSGASETMNFDMCMESCVLFLRGGISTSAWLILIAFLHPGVARSAFSNGADFTASLQYLNFGKSGQARRVASDAAGNIVVVATVSNDQLYAYGSPTQT